MTKNNVGKKVNREEEDFIQSLKKRNDELQKENNNFQVKLKNASLTLQKYKQELQSLKIRYGTGPSLKKKHNRESHDGCKLSVAATCDEVQNYSDDMTMVLSKLQERLLKSESTIDSLRSENELLKSMKANMERHIAQNLANSEERDDEVRLIS